MVATGSSVRGLEPLGRDPLSDDVVLMGVLHGKPFVLEFGIASRDQTNAESEFLCFALAGQWKVDHLSPNIESLLRRHTDPVVGVLGNLVHRHRDAYEGTDHLALFLTRWVEHSDLSDIPMFEQVVLISAAKIILGYFLKTIVVEVLVRRSATFLGLMSLLGSRRTCYRRSGCGGTCQRRCDARDRLFGFGRNGADIN
jgi:hypothetical protein